MAIGISRPLRKTKPNNSWMNGFVVHKSRNYLPIRTDVSDHAYAPGTASMNSKKLAG